MSMWPQYTFALATFIIIDSLVLTIIVGPTRELLLSM